MCAHTLNIHKHIHLLSKCLWREISVYSFHNEKLELIAISQYPHITISALSEAHAYMRSSQQTPDIISIILLRLLQQKQQ